MSNENQNLPQGMDYEESGVEKLASGGENVLYTSLVNDGTRESQIKIYNAINSAEDSLRDHVGETVKITDIVAHDVLMIDEKTGAPNKTTRIVLIGDDGHYYTAVSEGLLGSIMKINALIGIAPWSPALEIIPREKTTRKGYRVMTLELA